ncbi:hypothetical protein K3G63_07345 [Hymenobacter sp. HSC-4F20]|nr:hypothetical protein [Hymenobacter sp. HSC-4F20]MBX0290248.1 hypothetical protein [Hymenobacter sp. HSC-4F20]
MWTPEHYHKQHDRRPAELLVGPRKALFFLAPQGQQYYPRGQAAGRT